jgi:predicted permease
MPFLHLASELGRTARDLSRRPAVPSLLALVVAVGITFLVTAFSVFDALLWRGTPYGPHERFLLLGEAPDRSSMAPMPGIRVDSYAAYQDAHDRGQTPELEGLIPFQERDVSLVADGVASKEVAAWLLPDAFTLLRSSPLFGRTPADPDGGARLAREIAIGERLWARRFGRRADVLGERVRLNGESAVIVGVMPARFGFHRFSEIWVAWSPAEIVADPAETIHLVGRIAGGSDANDARARLRPIYLAARSARVPVDSQSVDYASSGLFGRPPIAAPLATSVIASMVLVLVAACLNIATLYLARLRRRAPDYATRQALGAGPAGVLRHLFSEIGIIVATGGVAAAVATVWVTAYIRQRMSGILLGWVDIRLDGRGFAVTLVVLALVFAIVAWPGARLLRRLDLARLLTHKGVLGGAPKHGRGAAVLIGAQVAIVVCLAAAALPIAISALNLAGVESGVAADRIVKVDVRLTGARYDSVEARDAYSSGVLRALRAEHGVAAAALVGGPGEWRALPGRSSDTIYTDASADPLPRSRRFRVWTSVVSTDYFTATGLPVLAGRTFDAGLAAGGERVAVLAAETARRLWPGQPAVGRRFRHGADGEWVTVIGVVGDRTGIWSEWTGTTAGPDPIVYVSDQQAVAINVSFYARAVQVTPSFIGDVRSAVERVDATQPVARARLLAEEFSSARIERQWIAVVLGSGAVAAVLLSIIGVVGLVSYYTTARLPELALRIALGAPLRRVVWLVARNTLRSVGFGLLGGALTLAFVQDGIRRFTYDTSTTAPVTLLLIAGVVMLVALVALAVPLSRLRRLSPQQLLRAE